MLQHGEIAGIVAQFVEQAFYQAIVDLGVDQARGLFDGIAHLLAGELRNEILAAV